MLAAITPLKRSEAAKVFAQSSDSSQLDECTNKKGRHDKGRRRSALTTTTDANTNTII